MYQREWGQCLLHSVLCGRCGLPLWDDLFQFFFGREGLHHWRQSGVYSEW
jgi:hypothetical protein